MKAWMVYCDFPGDGSLLVYASTRNKARSLACKAGLWEWEYQYTSCVRRNEFDKFSDIERVMETNDDLPKEAPDFYDDSAI